VIEMNGAVGFAFDIIIAYGSNQNSGPMVASQQFEAVVKALVHSGLRLKAQSRIWGSKAWPNTSDPPFVNAVLKMSTSLDPSALLIQLKAIESKFGRKTGPRNAPRTVDLDIIAYADLVIRSEGLIIPHESAHLRAFVMGPLCEIDPDWHHPVLGIGAKSLWQAATIGADAKPIQLD